jgi:quinol monooxygenase YgiN
MKWASVLEFLEAPTLTDAKDSLVILATLQYDGEKDVKEALSGREGAVKSTAKEEHGTLSYAIGSYVETFNRLTFVEIYESKQYLEEVHMRSEVLQKQLEGEQSLRKPKMQVRLLKKVTGYLHK